jgi:biotin carboxylase
MLTILCIATYFKGEAFLRECRQAGCTVLLLTNEQLTNADWPRDVIDEIHGIAREADDAAVRRAADAIVRRHPVDRIAAIDDFDVETAAMLREHLQVAGMGRTTASRFRDKLAMRVTARDRGIRVPEFTAVFNDRAVNEWIARVPPPWVLKPRSSAGAIGIKKVNSGDELWHALHAAADKRSACMLEQFVAGEVYHVDSIIWNKQVVFAVAFKYGRPPMQIAHEGGIFVTRRVPDTSAEGGRLLDINERLHQEFGMRRGVSHTEFIGSADGLMFLETSARVGGAFIADTIEAATDINLWREWAKLEVAGEHGGYTVPPHRRDYAAVVLSLARQENPDMSAYIDPEIKTRIRKHHHAGLVISSPDPERVEHLISEYTARFYRDFFATVPPPERPLE